MLIALQSKDAIQPRRGTIGSAGVDLYSAENVSIKPQTHSLVSTDLSCKLPKGCYGRIAPRSSLALKFGLHIGAGVIDSDYTGIIKVLVFNFGSKMYVIKKGDRFAQMICEKIVIPNIKRVSNITNTTQRGGKGFGSTGK